MIICVNFVQFNKVFIKFSTSGDLRFILYLACTFPLIFTETNGRTSDGSAWNRKLVPMRPSVSWSTRVLPVVQGFNPGVGHVVHMLQSMQSGFQCLKSEYYIVKRYSWCHGFELWKIVLYWQHKIFVNFGNEKLFILTIFRKWNMFN